MKLIDRIAADPRVESVDDGRAYRDNVFVNLKAGFQWSEQGSFGCETVREAYRLLQAVTAVEA